MESRSIPYNCVDLSDIPYMNCTLDIVNKWMLSMVAINTVINSVIYDVHMYI